MGNIWIGTANGLNKFDQSTETFRRYKHSPENINSLNNNYISALHIDSSNNIWVGTSNGGLNKAVIVNRQGTANDTLNFKHFLHSASNSNSICNNDVNVIFEDSKAMPDGHPDDNVIRRMVSSGIVNLTGKSLAESYSLLFTKDDIVGIKVNPVGAGLISTRLEVVEAVIDWLVENGLPKENIVIWDRFDYMLRDAGFTSERFPGIRIEGLQTMDEAAAEGKSGNNSGWLDENGVHVSAGNFDKEVYYWADIDGPEDEPYLNQHVFNEKFSYFGKLLTKKWVLLNVIVAVIMN